MREVADFSSMGKGLLAQMPIVNDVPRSRQTETAPAPNVLEMIGPVDPS
jgi:hypothetical protein